MISTKIIGTEENLYENGTRINKKTTETTYELSDDLSILAQHHNSLAMNQAAIERNKKSMKAIMDSSQSVMMSSELTRLEREQEVLRRAIEIQNGIIKGYPKEE